MKKKFIYIIVGIVILLILGLTIAIIEKVKFEKNMDIQEQFMGLVEEGQYDEAQMKCNQMSYKSICQAIILMTKIRQGETVTEEECNRISSEDDRPFWMKVAYKGDYLGQMLNLKQECLAAVDEGDITREDEPTEDDETTTEEDTTTEDDETTEEPAGEGCTDSDGGQIYTKAGTTTLKKNNNVITENEDMCADEAMLIEYFCDESIDPKPTMEYYVCETGCKDGACVEGTTA